MATQGSSSAARVLPPPQLRLGPLLALDDDNERAYWSYRGDELLAFVSSNLSLPSCRCGPVSKPPCLRAVSARSAFAEETVTCNHVLFMGAGPTPLGTHCNARLS